MENRILNSISFIIPCFNEEKSIAATVSNLKKELESLNLEFEIILVNDGSRDKTVAEAIKSYEGLKIIQHPINVGYGASLKSGIRAAKHDWIGIVDGDGTYDLPSLSKLVDQANLGFDMVVARRENIDHIDSAQKKIFRKIFSLVVKFLIHKTIEDPNSGFRIFRKQVVLEVFPFLCRTFSFTTSMTILILGNGHFVKYVDTPYHERLGHSKVTHFWDTIRTIQMIVQGITFFNPMKFFILYSIFSIPLICIPAMFLALFNMHTLSLYYMLFGVMVSFLVGFGVLGDIIRVSILNGNRLSKFNGFE